MYSIQNLLNAHNMTAFVFVFVAPEMLPIDHMKFSWRGAETWEVVFEESAGLVQADILPLLAECGPVLRLPSRLRSVAKSARVRFGLMPAQTLMDLSAGRL